MRRAPRLCRATTPYVHQPGRSSPTILQTGRPSWIRRSQHRPEVSDESRPAPKGRTRRAGAGRSGRSGLLCACPQHPRTQRAVLSGGVLCPLGRKSSHPFSLGILFSAVLSRAVLSTICCSRQGSPDPNTLAPPLPFRSNTELLCGSRKVDIRLPGEGNSSSHGTRPVHQIISMIK